MTTGPEHDGQHPEHVIRWSVGPTSFELRTLLYRVEDLPDDVARPQLQFDLTVRPAGHPVATTAFSNLTVEAARALRARLDALIEEDGQ